MHTASLLGVALLALAPATTTLAAPPPDPVANATADSDRLVGPDVLTLDEAAALLRVDAATVARLAQSQRIPARRLDTDWRFSRSALIIWLAGDWRIRTLVDPATVLAEAAAEPTEPTWGTGSRQLTAQASAAVVGRGGAAGSTSQAAPTTDGPIGTRPEQRSASEVFLRDQRVLLAPNEFTLDVGVVYTRRDTTLLTLVDGATTLASAESEAYATQLTARYSVRRDTEVWASTSYAYRQASLYAGADRLDRASRREAGDVGVGLRYTLVPEGSGRPDVVLGIDARVPTGDTSYAIGTSVTLVKSLDPVVLFGTFGYRRTFSREFDDVSRLEPRHRIDLRLGYAFALNDTLSLNTSLDSSVSRAARFDNADLRASHTSSLQFGMTARVGTGVYLQPSVTYRLTGPGSGFALGLNVPITFSSPGL